MRRERKFLNKHVEDEDPLSGMANLFDVAMVFAVALMVAIVSHYRMNEFFSKDDFTLIKNPGKENMEIVTKKDDQIIKYKGTQGSGEGKGKRIGSAYKLETGEIIYVPE
ncbi:MAG: DUF2149 domain-containing protein [Bacteroidales bacterium]|nr:DUF2149 domain-containing protein [Bacteroidales bacterium]